MKISDNIILAFDKYYAYIDSLDYYNVSRVHKMIRTRLYNKFIKECEKSGVNFSEASAYLGLSK